MVKFSVVIVARNLNNYLLKHLPIFKNQTFKDFEIIVILESSEKKDFYKTRIISSGRVNPAKARNIGVNFAKGEIIAFIDDDAYPEKNWLKEASRIFEDKNISAVGGPGLIPKESTFFQKVSSKVYALSSKKIGMRYERFSKVVQIDDWPTCNFLVRKKDFLEVGGFDSKSWGAEDNQLCYALVNKGKKIIYNPKVIVYHHPRNNLKNHLKQTFFWGMWRAFLTKNYPKHSFRIIFMIPSFFVLWLFFGGLISILYPPILYLYIGTLIVYILFLIVTGIRSKSLRLFFPVIIVTAITQVAYGIGFIEGLFLKEPTNKTFNPAKTGNIKL